MLKHNYIWLHCWSEVAHLWLTYLIDLHRSVITLKRLCLKALVHVGFGQSSHATSFLSNAKSEMQISLLEHIIKKCAALKAISKFSFSAVFPLLGIRLVQCSKWLPIWHCKIQPSICAYVPVLCCDATYIHTHFSSTSTGFLRLIPKIR